MDRREFLQNSSVLVGSAIAVAGSTQAAIAKPNDRISVCMIGMRGRGGKVLESFASLPDVDIKYVCDIDEKVLESRAAQIEAKTGKRPIAIKDYRKALDDKSLDAVAIGTPDHWHALPTIHGCQAGKDVYVEKPDGHNIMEGRTMVAAAKKHGRIVQMGTQARSGTHMMSAMKYLSEGHLGKVRFAKAWESSKQKPVVAKPDSAPPAGVDYDTWLGPAPKRAFNPNRFHGSWRWYFDYGSGDLGNDGVHRLDMARWALETAVAAKGEPAPGFPVRISALGGKYYFEDDQEWPDTLMVTYDYAAGYLLTYEMRIWSAYHLHDEEEGAAVYGDNGYMVIGNTRWRAFDPKGKEVIAEDKGPYNDVGHAANFVECMRTRKKPTADLETVGHPSSLLCHLGNAAWRVKRQVTFDPVAYKFIGDDAANQYITRAEYRKPFVLPAIAEL